MVWKEGEELLRRPALAAQYADARHSLILNTDEGRQAAAWAAGTAEPVGDLTWLRRVFQALLHCVCAMRKVRRALCRQPCTEPAARSAV